MAEVTLKDKTFGINIENSEILAAVERVADQINADYKDEVPLFISVLNGAFIFTADLMKFLTVDCLVSFAKFSSYEGTESTGKVKTLMGFGEEVNGRSIIILEDIVDSGTTVEHIMEQMSAYQPKDVRIATLLFKPDAYKKDIPIHYKAIEVPNDFLVGYGLDYDGLGRNLKDIYKLVE